MKAYSRRVNAELRRQLQAQPRVMTATSSRTSTHDKKKAFLDEKKKRSRKRKREGDEDGSGDEDDERPGDEGGNRSNSASRGASAGAGGNSGPASGRASNKRGADADAESKRDDVRFGDRVEAPPKFNFVPRGGKVGVGALRTTATTRAPACYMWPPPHLPTHTRTTPTTTPPRISALAEAKDCRRICRRA
jgi:hypothetical protein